MMPMVSAIITTYKRPIEIVERAINSVVRQSYREMEIILVDDNPDDLKEQYKLNELETKFAQNRLRYITYPGNHGACYARNAGLSEAKGDFVAFLDDDDEWMAEKIEKQMALMADENVALVYCSAKNINETSGEVTQGRTCVFRGDIYPQLIMKNFIGSTSFPLIRKSCLQAVGGFDVQMQASQDYDLWLRLSQRYRIDYVNEELGLYHVHGGERLTTNPDKRIAGLERIIEKNRCYLEQKTNKHAKAARLIGLAPFYAKKGELGKAIGIWWSSVKLNPGALRKNVNYIKFILINYHAFLKKDGNNQ